MTERRTAGSQRARLTDEGLGPATRTIRSRLCSLIAKVSLSNLTALAYLLRRVVGPDSSDSIFQGSEAKAHGTARKNEHRHQERDAPSGEERHLNGAWTADPGNADVAHVADETARPTVRRVVHEGRTNVPAIDRATGTQAAGSAVAGLTHAAGRIARAAVQEVGRQVHASSAAVDRAR